MPSFDAGKIEGTADLDLTPFHRALDEAEARAEAFEAHTYTARLGLDDSEGLRHLADMRDRLDEYEKRHYTAKVGVDAGTGRADIEALRREIDSLDKTVHVRVVTSGSGGTSSGGGSGGDLFSSLRSGLLGTAIALSPGAIPLAGVAGAGLLGTAGGLGVAGAGLGAFGLAAAPQVKALTTDLQQLTAARTAYNKAVLEGSKSGEHDALAQQKNILAGLNAEQKTALGGLIAFQGAYKSFQHDLQPTVLLVLQDVLTTASHLLPIVEPLAKTTGTALDSIVRGFDHQISGGGLASFIQSLSKDVGPDLRLVATIIENLAADGGRLLLALQPLAMTVLPALDRATHGLGQGDGLTKFIGYAVKEAPVVGHALSEIIGLGGSLIRALAPLGGQVLVDVGKLAHALGHDLASPGFTAFVHDLVQSLPAVEQGLEHVANAAVTVLQDLGPILPVLASLANDAATLVDDLGPVAPAILGVWAAVKGFGILSDAEGAIAAFARSGIGFFGLMADAAVRDAVTVREAWTLARQSAIAGPTGIVAGGKGGGKTTLPLLGTGAVGTVVTLGLLTSGDQAPSWFDPKRGAPQYTYDPGSKQYGIRNNSGEKFGVTILNDKTDPGGSGRSAAAAALNPSTHRTDVGDLSAAYGAAHPLAPTHRTDIGDLAKANPTSEQQTQALLNQINGAGNLTPFGADPGVGGGGGAAAAANAQLVDYQRQIGTGFASAIKRGVPAVQDETRKLRDTILTEFKNPAAARERRQALDLLAQEAPKALRQAQANAEAAARVLGTQITQALVKAVQTGTVAHEITSLESKVVKTLNGPDDAAERKKLLADLEHQLPILKGYTTQYTTLQATLAADKTRLANLQSQEAQFRDSAYGALSGGASLTDAASSGQGITGYLTGQLTALQAFAGELKQLKAAGVGQAALEMIVAAGPTQGGAIAKALLTSGTAGTASNLIDAIQTLAGTTADDVEHQVYDPQIAAVIAEQQNTTAAVNALNATILKSAQTTGKTVSQGLSKVGKTAVVKSKAPTTRKRHTLTRKA